MPWHEIHSAYVDRREFLRPLANDYKSNFTPKLFELKIQKENI